ncbi:MAG TPA: hypothetical protein VIJ46_04680, partial [Rhabdochlamydiaceae bacterium]
MFHLYAPVMRFGNLDAPSIPKKTESDTTCKKTESTALCFFEGLTKSKITRAILITGAVVGVAFLLASNPVGWLATALGVSTLAAALIFAGGCVAVFGLSVLVQKLLCDSTLEFEAVAPYRLMKEKDNDDIEFSQWKR